MKTKLKLPTANLIFEVLTSVTRKNDLTFSERWYFKKVLKVFKEDAEEYASRRIQLIKDYTDWREDPENNRVLFDPIIVDGELDKESWGKFEEGVKELGAIENNYEFDPLTLDFVADLKCSQDDLDVLMDNGIVVEK